MIDISVVVKIQRLDYSTKVSIKKYIKHLNFKLLAQEGNLRDKIQDSWVSV